MFGVSDTLQTLEMGAVETLICWENLDITRFQLKNPVSGGVCSTFKLAFQQRNE